VIQRLIAPFVLALSLMAAAAAPAAEPGGPRIDQIQQLGSHNSYKRVPDKDQLDRWRAARPEGYPNLEYGHPSLAAQLDLGVRQLEIDIYADSRGGLFSEPYSGDPAALEVMNAPGIKVLHMWRVDTRVHCLTLALCLADVARWSEQNPDHGLVTILINTHDIDEAHRLSAPEPMSATSLDELDRTARQAFGAQLLTPDEVRAGAPSLRAAALAHQWPTQQAARGRIMMALDVGPLLSEVYREGHPSLQGRALFGFYPETDPEAAIFNIGDPIRDEARIRTLVGQGFIVRTRSDADTREARDGNRLRLDAAIRSRAQIISTDYYPGAPDILGLGFTADLDGAFVRPLPDLEVQPDLSLERVVYLYRHGLRAPVADEKAAAAFSGKTWPAWPVGEGALTERGGEAVRLMGAWDRAWLAAEGLMAATGCPAAGSVVLWTNSVSRTIGSGQALAEGFAPGCGLAVGHLPAGTPDPVFSPVDAGAVDFDARDIARIVNAGNSTAAMIAPHRAAFRRLAYLLGCDSRPQPCDLAAIPGSVVANTGGTALDVRGPIAIGSGAGQIFLLQYLEGLPLDQVGWGMAGPDDIAWFSRLHALQVDIRNRTDVAARVMSAPLAHRVAQALQPGAPPVTILVAHDGHIAGLSSLLGVHFQLEGYGYDDPPIGGALRLEVLRNRRTGESVVRASYQAQRPDQIRNLTPLGVDAPPSVQDVVIGRCRPQRLTCPLAAVTRGLQTGEW